MFVFGVTVHHSLLLCFIDPYEQIFLNTNKYIFTQQ